MTILDKLTTDHQKIKRWIEDHDGRPAATAGSDMDNGVVKILFPDFGISNQLEEISWNEFFNRFEQSDLAFQYAEDIEDGDEIRAFKFIHR